MIQPVNPYVAGRPLKEESGFFGRADTVKWVTQELLNATTNALVLFGQRRIGKTTLLLHLERILARSDFFPVYFDLQDLATRPLDQVLLDLADAITERLGLDLPDFGTIDERGSFFRRSFLPHLYGALTKGCRPVLLLDEFDVLHQTEAEKLPENVANRALFPFLRSLMNEEPRLAFVFAVGRRAEDLSTNFTSIFKGALVREMWVLDEESATSLILQAQNNGTLNFTEQAVQRILSLTGRHPYITQLLCQRVWERAHMQDSAPSPNISPAEVEGAVSDALEVGKSALLWLWQGLNPAERVYAAALAQAAGEDHEIISEDEVIRVLGRHAGRLRAQKVELAPRELVKRRVLEACGDRDYRFAVEIFRRWVRRYQPLHNVKDELDQVYPLADELFNIGQRFSDEGDWEKAVGYFTDALETDPRHFQAYIQLGEAFLVLGRVKEALAKFRTAYELDPKEARFPLARGLVTQAKELRDAGDEDGALTACSQALEVSPREEAAHQIREMIWIRRGNAALEQGNLETALAAYQQAGAAGWEDALGYAREALESDPLLFRIRFYLGELLMQLGRADKAIEGLDAALCVYKQESFNRIEAIDYFQFLLKREPDKMLARLHLGGLLLAEGRIEEAVEQLERAYDLNPAMAQNYLVHGLFQQAQVAGQDGDFLVALDAYLGVLRTEVSHVDVVEAIERTLLALKQEREQYALRSPDKEEAAERMYCPLCIDRKELSELVRTASRRVRLLGVVALDLNWVDLAREWAKQLRNKSNFQVTVLCESDNFLFAKSFTLDTDMAKKRRSFRELKFIRDRALQLPDFLRDAGFASNDRGNRESVEVEVMHLPMPISIAQIDDRIFAGLWLHEVEDHFEGIAQNHPWHSLIEEYISTYFDPKRGRKYTCDPSEELLELYDHDRIPRGIYPRESFYDTDFSQVVVWAFVFDRQGRLLIHRRSDNAKDNQGMWDKSVGGHFEFTDYRMSRAAYREVVEELFTEEPEDVKSDLKKWAISDEEIVYLGDWRPETRMWYPFREIRSFSREWAYFSLPEVEGLERLYSPRTLPGGKVRRLRVIPDVFLFVAGPQLTEGFLVRLKNSTFKLVELPELKSVMDRAIAGEKVPGFDENRFDERKIKAVPAFTPDLQQVMTGKLRDVLEEFSQYIKRFIELGGS